MQVISRKDARAKGLTHFFTGVPCVHGHIAKRYASNQRCVKCAYDGYGEGRGRQRQDAIAAGKKFYLGRPCPRGHRKRYSSTGVCHECASEAGLARSRAERQSRPRWYTSADTAAIGRMRRLAVLMSEITGAPWELDHIIPINGADVCGLHVASNIQAMPRNLNRRKGNSFNGFNKEVA